VRCSGDGDGEEVGGEAGRVQAAAGMPSPHGVVD
jgi:hypothetical protein